MYFFVLYIISMPNNCHECMKELSINTNINLYLFLFFIWYFWKTLGSPMVVMSVWKSFVATNPDALRYFTIYNWRRWNRIVIVTGVHVIVKYALQYFTRQNYSTPPGGMGVGLNSKWVGWIPTVAIPKNTAFVFAPFGCFKNGCGRWRNQF